MGLNVAQMKAVTDAMELRSFRDDAGKPLVDLSDAPLPDAETPAPARFLPVWDASLLVHARRTQILPEEYRALVFNTKTPHSVKTFLVDGQVAGTWRHTDGRIELAPFGKLAAADRRAARGGRAAGRPPRRPRPGLRSLLSNFAQDAE
jgi:hypothetical protein